MSHLYSVSSSKGGDQLCPLGFHPQVRWPTRCKRCFRDYKEHGSRRIEDVSYHASTPALDRSSVDKTIRSWTSTQNLSSPQGNSKNDTNSVIEVTAPLRQRPSSWASTPEGLDDAQKKVSLPPKPVEEVTVSVHLPRRRPVTVVQVETNEQIEESFTLKRPVRSNSTTTNGISQSTPPQPAQPTPPVEDAIIINKTDSLAERVRKMQMLKRQGSQEREGSVTRQEPETSTKSEADQQSLRRRRQTDPLPPIPDEKPAVRSRANLPPVAPRSRTEIAVVLEKSATQTSRRSLSRSSSDSAKVSDDVNTESENTYTNNSHSNSTEVNKENEILRRELETIKSRCERVEREKSDILLRRLAAVDSSSNRTTAASEVLKLQQKVNEMTQKIDDLENEKRTMSTKLKNYTSKSVEEKLRSKLEQAEKMCEDLMDENEKMKKEMKNMETEMDEIQDNFREDQADEYVTVKKELEQTTKNCRILSFKLKKSEKKIEMMELEKSSIGIGNHNSSSIDQVKRIKQLEDELKIANEVARRLQTESESTNSKKKAPTLGMIGKSTSDGGKVSRQSLTRGGSQEDPVQLLRDLQDSIEREADLREQLKFAEEEAESLRKKSSRVDDENESLLMQVKKMATKARKRLRSPNASRNSLDIEKDEGISDEEDTAELKLQLELNEQEAQVLRRKVEDLESESELNRRQISDLQEKLTKAKEASKGTKSILKSTTGKIDPLNDKKIQVMEEEMNELRKKLIEKDREVERIEAESSLKGKSKLKSKSIDDLQTIEIKRQLQVVEQEASVLRTKTQTLEQENENMLAEVKRLQIASGKITSAANLKEMETLKKSVEDLSKERDELKKKIKRVLDDPTDKLPKRTPKIFSDTKTKLQLKRMIEELEDEILEMRAIAARAGGGELKTLESEKLNLAKELADMKSKLEESTKSSKDSSSTITKDAEVKLQKSLIENKSLNDKISKLEDKMTKQESVIKQMENTKATFEKQVKVEKDKLNKLERDFEKCKIDKAKWETKSQAIEAELSISKKSSEKAKKQFESEINELREKTKSNDFPSKKIQELQDKIKELERSLESEFKRNNESNSRYELLEEEHVLFKAQLTTENEKLHAEIKNLKAQITKFTQTESTSQSEVKELKSKMLDLQRKLTEAELKGSKTNSSFDLEKSRLKSKLDDTEIEFSKLQRQNEMNLDQISSLRKDNDDLRRKLDDFERINKVQRSLNEHNATLENELKKLKVKLDSSEMAVKSEVAATRLRYETQINTLQNELTSTHRQCDRFKKDRDSCKQLLEAAQRSIAELKQNHNRKSYTSTSSGDEDDKLKVHLLEQKVGNLEDELSESRLEASKTRTSLISEKSSFEIRISELQSKLNEYEEERLLSKSKVPGTRSRLELTWQKERDEQQRLLAETSTLARDLRQTLFEVERERDKERLESRRKVDQIKKSTEEEMEEGRKKISELQSDLLELRDAHAKMRTANEKLRRDRDRSEREYGGSTRRRATEHENEKKVHALLQQVDELMKIAPELQNISKESSQTLPIPKTASRSKSRSPSPAPPTVQLSSVLARVGEASEELRRYQRFAEEERERERVRRSGMRRAASQENDNLDNANSMNRPIVRLNRQGSLHRKCLSLDQSMQSEQQQVIWKDSDAGSMSSMQSLDSEYGIRRGDVSVDSRISVGSTQSDMPGRRKKKKGIMGKLRSLAGRGTESDASLQGSDSDLSLAGELTAKKDLKHKISGMFKRAGSSSRSGSRANSSERILDSSQRPISIASTGSASTLPTNFTLQQVQAPTTTSKTKPPTPSSQKRVRPSSASSSSVRSKI